MSETNAPDDTVVGPVASEEPVIASAEADHEHAGKPAETHESNEAEPKLKVYPAWRCKGEGAVNTLGIASDLREGLGLKLYEEKPGEKPADALVVVTKDGKDVGIFHVGRPHDKKHDIKHPHRISANSLPLNTDAAQEGEDSGLDSIEIRKLKETDKVELEFAVTHGIEQTPNSLSVEEAAKYTARTAQRKKDVGEKFPDVDPEEFVVVPTHVLTHLTGNREKAKIKISFSGKVVEVVAIPSGLELGMTTKAAVKIGMPTSITSRKVCVERGLLSIA